MCSTKIAELYFIYYLQTVNNTSFRKKKICISQILPSVLRDDSISKEHICLPFDLQDWKHGSWRMLPLLAAL